MKKLFSFILVVTLAMQGIGQLVNGSFESYVALPSTLGDWALIDNWNNAGSANSTPDYFHAQANIVADLPETPSAIVEAYDGSAIVGLALCSKVGANRREYLSTYFDQPLVVGQEYHLSFRITNGVRTTTSLAGLAVDNIGVLLSTTATIQTALNPIVANPQFVIDTVLYSQKWERATFSFIADQPYEHLTIGVFNDDNSCSIVHKEGFDAQFAYYFVDDFTLTTEFIVDEPLPNNPDTSIVYTDPPVSPVFVPNAFTPNGDGDNDIFIPVAGTVKEWYLEIFTKWGDPVFNTKIATKGWDGNCSGKPCANGNYVWKITYRIPDAENEWRTISEQGVVCLVK